MPLFDNKVGSSNTDVFSEGQWYVEDFADVATTGVLAINGGSTKTFTTDSTVGVYGLSGMNTATAAALSGSSRFHMLASSHLTQEASVGHKALFGFSVPTFSNPANMGYELRMGLIDAPPNTNAVVNGVYMIIVDDVLKMRIVNGSTVTESSGYTISRNVWYRVAYTITSNSSAVLRVYNGATNALLASLPVNAAINTSVRYGCQLVAFCTTTPTAAQELVRYDYFHQFAPRTSLPIPMQ